jgi:glycolate oxidase iron-sulfur subunit
MTESILNLIPSEEQYLNCVRCGLCLAVCPTYQLYKNEADSPRGRVALARKNLQEELALNQILMARLDGCLLCLACDEICPVGIKPAQLAMQMRAITESRRPAAWKKTVFRKIVAKPKNMAMLTLPLKVYEKFGLRSFAQRVRLNRLLPQRIRDLEYSLPPRFSTHTSKKLPVFSPARTQKKYEVGFFLGCAQDLLFRETSAATIRVLNHNDCDVTTPRNVVCCGMPADGHGLHDLALEHARQNIAVFEEKNYDFIVTDCATCGSKLRGYAIMLKDDPQWQQRAENFSSKVRDISEFLLSIPLKKPSGEIHASITYHDPCHLRRGQNVWQQPRELLKFIPGIELQEMEEAGTCCGSGGSHLISHYPTSSAILEKKVEDILKTGATMVASGCPGCQMQLNAGLRRKGLAIQVTHPIVLLDQAYRLPEELHK